MLLSFLTKSTRVKFSFATAYFGKKYIFWNKPFILKVSCETKYQMKNNQDLLEQYGNTRGSMVNALFRMVTAVES